MVKKEVKIGSDATYVFINGVRREVKEEAMKSLTSSGYLAEGLYQSYVMILMFLIPN